MGAGSGGILDESCLLGYLLAIQDFGACFD